MYSLFSFAICCNNVLLIRIEVMVTQYIYLLMFVQKIDGEKLHSHFVIITYTQDVLQGIQLMIGISFSIDTKGKNT